MSQTTLNYQVVNSLEDALDSKNDKGSSSNAPFSRAQVLRTDDDGTTWVHIAGGVQETPANGGSVTSVKDKDQVLVNISDGKCSIIGNLTAPSSDDTEAKSAKETAISASKNSKDAEEQAKKAAESSNTNWQRLFTDSQVWTVAPKGSQPSTSPMDWTTEKPTNIQPGVQVWSATRRLYNDSVVELHDIVPYTGIVSQTTYYWQTIVPENGTVPDKPTGIEPEGWLQTPPPLASSDAKDEYANANIYSSVRTFYGDGSYAWSDPSRNGFASTWVNNVYTLQSVKSQTEVNAEAITKHSTSIEQNAEKIETNAKSIKTVQDSSDANATDLANYILEQKATNESLQGQIDGSIMTWFYEVPPTVDNEPANAWTTDKLKNQHLGDLYYDTKTGYCYRYQLFNGEYSWQQITDVDITKALADAKTAQDLADNKRRVFVETPKPPYDSGDLWVQGSTGDILVCRTPKTSEQSYAESDWRLASKYTDNSYAETKFTETSEKIEAQAKKIEANTTSIATVTETANGLKTSVEQNTNDISGLNTAIGNKADSNSVYTKTEIDQKSDSITSTAKSYADTKNKIFTDTPVPPYRVGDLWAQGSSGDIKVCIKANNRNYLYNTDEITEHSGTFLTNYPYLDFYKKHVHIPSDETVFTLSFDAKATINGTHVQSYFYNPNNIIEGLTSQGLRFTAKDGLVIFELSAEWERYWVTWTSSEGVSERDVIIGRLVKPDSNGASVSIRAAKLEVGTKATAWTPAPEENQTYAATDWVLASKYTDDSSLNTFKTEYNTYVTQTAKEIKAKASQTDVDSLGNRVTTAESEIKANSDSITTEVTARKATDENLANNYSKTGQDSSYDKAGSADKALTTAKSYTDQTATSITQSVSETAKSYADTKNKIFTDTPVPPYRVGDLWAQGSSGDIKVCIKAKTENQTYAATDWVLASKYTDDSSLNTFKTEYNTYVTQTAKEIKAKASQTDVDSLGNRVTTAESKIKANSDSITTEVTARKATDENLANNYSKTGQDSSYDKAGSADKALTTAKSYTDQTATSITQSVSENLAASNSTIKQLADSITSGVTGAKEITLPDGTVQTTIDFSQVQQSADSVKFMFGNDYPTSGDNLADMLSNVFDEASKIATNYITEITGSGIKVHPSTGSGYVQISDNIKVASNDNNYAQIDSDKYSIISNGETVSSFGEDEINLGNNSKNSYLYLSKKSGAISGIYRDINGSDTTGTRFNDNSLRLETSDYYGFDGKRTIDAVIQGNIGYYPLVVSGGNISGYQRSSTLLISASVYDNSYDYGYDVTKGSAGLFIYAGIGSNTSGELDPKADTDIDISANTITFEANHLQSYAGISFAYGDDSTHTYFPLYSVAVDTSGYAYRWSADEKWVRVTVNDIVAANAAAHNAIYRGKDITSMETSGKLYVNIANGTFDDIYIGDYFTKSINGKNYVLRIAAFNYYCNMGEPAFTKPHAVIIPDSIFGSAKMNSSNVVTGGYIGTKMRTETLQTWLKYLKTAFGSHLLTPRCWYDNKCDGSSYSGGAWYDGPLELMTEEQVYGARQQGITNHSGWYYPGVDYAQFPLFALDHSRICNRSRWWLRSVYSSTSFTYVSYLGTATYDGAATSAQVGIRPRFLIG